jgi:hypothetical protein
MTTVTFSDGSWVVATPTTPRGRVLTPATNSDADAAQSVIESHLPAGAKLVHAIVTLPEGRGILSCRLDDAQTQVRF